MQSTMAAVGGFPLTWLNETNSLTWSFKIEMYLRREDLWAIVQTLLQDFFDKSSQPREGEKNKALMAFTLLGGENIPEVMNVLLEHPISTTQEIWLAIFPVASKILVLDTVLKQMQGPPGEQTPVHYATQVMKTILSAPAFEKQITGFFPRLLVTLLAQILTTLEDGENVPEPLETMQLLCSVMGVVGKDSECWEQLRSLQHFSKGLTNFVRVILNNPCSWLPELMDFLHQVILDEEYVWLSATAEMLYVKLLLNRVKELGNCLTTNSLLMWLDHSKLSTRKLSLRGVSGLIQASELIRSPWCAQLVSLKQLGLVRPHALGKLLQVLESYAVRISGEEGAAFKRLLAATYSALLNHEEMSMRALVLRRLKRIRTWRKERCPPEEALEELVGVLVHLEDGGEVAKQVRTYLRHLVPQVGVFLHPRRQNFQGLLEHVAEYLIRTYSQELIRGAALSCALHPCTKEPGVFLVGACLVGHLAHKKGTFLKQEDIDVYFSWLQSNTAYADGKEVGPATMGILHRAIRQKGLRGLVKRCASCEPQAKHPPEYTQAALDDHGGVETEKPGSSGMKAPSHVPAPPKEGRGGVSSSKLRRFKLAKAPGHIPAPPKESHVTTSTEVKRSTVPSLPSITKKESRVTTSTEVKHSTVPSLPSITKK